MKQFEVLQYKTPNDTDSLTHNWSIGRVDLDLSKNVLRQLDSQGLKVSRLDLSDADHGVIECLDLSGRAIYQLRD